MIRFEKFIETVKTEIRLLCGDGYQIIIEPIPRNNGTEHTGIDIRKEHGEEMAHLNLDSYYEQYLAGMDIEEIVKDIWDIFNSFEQKEMPNRLLEDFEKAKDKIVFSLVNYEMNKARLQSIPYVPFLDLAIIFDVLLDRTESGQRTVDVTNKELTAWGTTKEELLFWAKKNTPRLYMAEISLLDDVVKSFSDGIAWDGYFDGFMKEKEHDFYVLGNRNGIKGAAVILYEGLLKEMAKSLESDLLILPSSIHEILVMAYNNEVNLFLIKDMVERINQSEIPLCDVLSNEIYRYSREKEEISMIRFGMES